VTVADIAVYQTVVDFIKPFLKDDLTGPIEDHRNAIAALPNIAAYRASNRRPAITLPPMVGVLCTPEDCSY